MKRQKCVANALVSALSANRMHAKGVLVPAPPASTQPYAPNAPQLRTHLANSAFLRAYELKHGMPFSEVKACHTSSSVFKRLTYQKL